MQNVHDNVYDELIKHMYSFFICGIQRISPIPRPRLENIDIKPVVATKPDAIPTCLVLNDLVIMFQNRKPKADVEMLFNRR